MASVTTIPVTLSEEAGARIAELGMQREFDLMVEHAKQTIPSLRAIIVELDYAPWLSEDPRIVLSACRPYLAPEEKATMDSWRDWFLDTFPPQVRIHFLLVPLFEEENGR